MKKLATILIFITILTLFFSACGKEKPKTVDGKKIVMGFIYIGPIGDGGWTYAHNQGRLYLEKETGIKTIFKESVPEDAEVKNVIRSMVDQGASIIAATSFGYMDYVAEISKEYPDVKFLHCSGYKMTANMGNYFGRIYEARYLSGIVAGLKSQTNKLGYVAAFEIPEVIRGINAFALGAQSVNPKAEVNVRWTHTWYDPAKEKEAAKALLDDGCDVIAQHQDTAGPQQAAEERKKFSIGYNSDMSAMAPDAYMTAPIWHWGPYYTEQVKLVMNNKWKPESYWGGMGDDIVQLAPLTKNAPKNASAKVEEVKKKIIDKKFFIFSGPLKNQQGKTVVPEGSKISDKEMLSMDWFVEGVKGTLKTK